MTSDPTARTTADFVSNRSGRLLVIRFQQALTLATFERCRRVISTTRASAGKPLLFVGVIPEGLPPLDGSVRKAVIGATPSMLEDCESIDITLLGGGLLHGLTRTVLRAMVVATRSTSQIFLHDSYEPLLKRLRNSGVDVRAALELDRQ
jgi:hypothetical protein